MQLSSKDTASKFYVVLFAISISFFFSSICLFYSFDTEQFQSHTHTRFNSSHLTTIYGNAIVLYRRLTLLTWKNIIMLDTIYRLFIWNCANRFLRLDWESILYCLWKIPSFHYFHFLVRCILLFSWISQ